jgi:hypothetical protein
LIVEALVAFISVDWRRFSPDLGGESFGLAAAFGGLSLDCVLVVTDLGGDCFDGLVTVVFDGDLMTFFYMGTEACVAAGLALMGDRVYRGRSGLGLGEFELKARAGLPVADTVADSSNNQTFFGTELLLICRGSRLLSWLRR